MSVSARKTPCPACNAEVRPRDVFENEACPECGTSLEDIFQEAREDPQQLGGITD